MSTVYNGVEIFETELMDGYSAQEIFNNSECQGITFDDLISLPAAIDFNVGDVDLTTRISRNYSLHYPLCSTPMDTVTESEMATFMALNGGIGFIHSNCTVDEQVAMIKKVKFYENGFILEPAVLSPNDIVSDLDYLRNSKKISGVPVTIDGKIGSKLVGLISNRDTDFLEDRSKRISDLMTPVEKLVTGLYPLSIEEANELLKSSKKGYLPVVDSDGNLRALTTRTDLKKQQAFPMSSKDRNGKLLVGAAVKASARDEIDMYRVSQLAASGCNIIIMDAQNGDCDRQIEYIKNIKKEFPDLDVIAGNVVRPSQAKALLDAGCDGLRIGMGSGSIATTQVVKAVGRPQLSSIYACAKLAKKYQVPVIADGGIKNTGCIIKALSIGASCVMMGSLLAGVTETPGDYFYQNGIRLKNYRANSSNTPNLAKDSLFLGSGSLSNPSSPIRQRSNSVTEWNSRAVSSGVSGAVVDKGPLNRYFPYLCQSIRHGLQDMGTRSLLVMWERLYSGELRFELRSPRYFYSI